MTYKAGGYEAHMTFDKQHAKEVQGWLELNMHEMEGFVFSVITGCPLLGTGVRVKGGSTYIF